MIFPQNYCGGDEVIFVQTEIEDLDSDEKFLALCDRFMSDMAYEKFGCAIGDFIDEEDEEEGNEELIYNADINEVVEEDLKEEMRKEGYTHTITMEEFEDGYWM